MFLRNIFNLNRYCKTAQYSSDSNYGYWIAPDGTKHDVPEDCGHLHALNNLGYDDYSCAFENMWVRVVGPKKPTFYNRVAVLNLEIPPAGITSQQYSTLQQMITETVKIARDSSFYAGLSFYIDLLSTSVGRNTKEHKGMDNAADVIAYLQSLITTTKEPMKQEEPQFMQQPQMAFSGRIFDLNIHIS